MSVKMQQAYGLNRLESKTARAAIIQKIGSDFNRMPIIAEAYYQQISAYFAQHADIELTSGPICYEAVAADEPAGKHIALAKKVSCRLTLNDVNSDLTQVVTLHHQGFPKVQIYIITHLSEKLIGEDLQLFCEYQQTERLIALLNPIAGEKKGD